MKPIYFTTLLIASLSMSALAAETEMEATSAFGETQGNACATAKQQATRESSEWKVVGLGSCTCGAKSNQGKVYGYECTLDFYVKRK